MIRFQPSLMIRRRRDYRLGAVLFIRQCDQLAGFGFIQAAVFHAVQMAFAFSAVTTTSSARMAMACHTLAGMLSVVPGRVAQFLLGRAKLDQDHVREAQPT